MTDTKHTEGPWFIVMSDNATPHIMTEPGTWQDVTNLDTLVARMPAEIMQSYNSLNNARLIAAAPELLEALKAVVEEIDCTYPFVSLPAAKVAIAKAEGKS